MTDAATTLANTTCSAPAAPPSGTETVPAIVRLARSTQIDIDSLDPVWARTLISLGVQPVDQTSNQVLIVQALLDPSNLPLLRDVISSLSSEGRNPSDWEAILDRFSVALCKRNDQLGIIPGRFLLQTSPRYASDKEAIVLHARNYAAEFERVGLGKDRFCIKVPATGAGMTASKELYADGIPTLGTSLFSVPQALAAAQAHCLSISPYFNEIPAHDRSPSRPAWPSDPHAWPDVPHPAREHPMAPRMWQIVALYANLRAAGKYTPQIKAASMIGALECLALGEEMHCQALTILAPVLKALVELRVPESHSNSPEGGDFAARLSAGLAQRDGLVPPEAPHPHPLLSETATATATQTDFLSHGGAPLDALISPAQDAETARRIQDSLDLFLKAEDVAREGVQRVVKGESLEGLVFGGL